MIVHLLQLDPPPDGGGGDLWPAWLTWGLIAVCFVLGLGMWMLFAALIGPMPEE